MLLIMLKTMKQKIKIKRLMRVQCLRLYSKNSERTNQCDKYLARIVKVNSLLNYFD